MSFTDAVLADLASAEKAKAELEEKLPFASRMKYRYWGPKAKLVLWGWVIKTIAVAGLVWGKVAMAWMAMNHPAVHAFMHRAGEKVTVLFVGFMALVFNTAS